MRWSDLNSGVLPSLLRLVPNRVKPKLDRAVSNTYLRRMRCDNLRNKTARNKWTCPNWTRAQVSATPALHAFVSALKLFAFTAIVVRWTMEVLFLKYNKAEIDHKSTCSYRLHGFFLFFTIFNFTNLFFKSSKIFFKLIKILQNYNYICEGPQFLYKIMYI